MFHRLIEPKERRIGYWTIEQSSQYAKKTPRQAEAVVTQRSLKRSMPAEVLPALTGAKAVGQWLLEDAWLDRLTAHERDVGASLADIPEACHDLFAMVDDFPRAIGISAAPDQ